MYLFGLAAIRGIPNEEVRDCEPKGIPLVDCNGFGFSK